MAIERVGVLKHLRLCVIVGGGLASFQAVLWVALTMVGVIMYGDCEFSEVTFDNYLGYVMRMMYFIDIKSCESKGKLIKATTEPSLMDSEQILVWESVYMAMSVFWLISSVLLIIYVTWEKIASALLYMYMWSCATLVISIVDLVLGALLGKDMDNISTFYSELAENLKSDSTEYIFQMMKFSAGVLMTVAMRGFILWIINVACAVYMFMCIVEINREQLKEGGDDYQHSGMARGPIGAYDNPSAETRSNQWLNGTGNIDRPHLKTASYGRANSQYGETNLGYSNSNFPSSNAVNNSSFGNNNSSFGNNSPSFGNSNSPKFGSNNNNSPSFGNNYNNNNQSRQPSALPSKPMPWERAREPITPSPDYDSPPPQRSAMKQNAPLPPSSGLYRR